jgi:hypothetical protein
MKSTRIRIAYFWMIQLFMCTAIVMMPVEVNAQNVSLTIGGTMTSTSFRTSDLREGGNHLLFTPKRGWAGEIGMEYAIKAKSSFYSSFAYYQSGAKLEEYDVIRIMDPYTGSTGYISETMIRESLGIYFFYRPR